MPSRDQPPSPGEITRLLQEWRGGDREAFEQVIPLIYDQLHAIAMGIMRRERSDHTLQPTALVHELYFRLEQQHSVVWEDRGHFFTFAAKLMRMILVDHARAHNAERRGGPNTIRLPLSEDMAWLGQSSSDMLDLDRALDRLEQLDARKARLIELRFFLSLTMDEASQVLSVSPATVDRDLRFAKSWLYRELRGGQGHEDAIAGQ
jgi:RNA polymerase sigma factor (TIGR02999 family)